MMFSCDQMIYYYDFGSIDKDWKKTKHTTLKNPILNALYDLK